MPFGGDTRVVPSNIVLNRGPILLKIAMGRGDLGISWGLKPPVKFVLQIVAKPLRGCGVVTINNLQELRNVPSSGTSADPIRLLLTPNNMFTASRLVPNDFGPMLSSLSSRSQQIAVSFVLQYTI